jgi:small subunit ribosomal protein S6e
MVDYKLVISDPKTGKSFAKDVKEQGAEPFVNKRIGETISGDPAGFAGYEFQITGGSDNCGFPMRKDVESARKKILYVGGVGLRQVGKGVRKRKTVCGNRITSKIAQINLRITKYGKEKLGGEVAPAKDA